MHLKQLGHHHLKMLAADAFHSTPVDLLPLPGFVSLSKNYFDLFFGREGQRALQVKPCQRELDQTLTSSVTDTLLKRAGSNMHNTEV